MNFRMLARSACAALVALAVVAFTGHARAQQLTPPPPSTGAINIASEILDVKGSMNIFEPVIPGVIEQAKNVFMQTSPNLSKDLDAVALILRKELAPRAAGLKTEVAKVYASRFTEQELKDALAFYKTPLGKKLLAEEPDFVERTLQTAQNWANQLSEEVLGKFRAEMRKKGHSL